MDSAFVLRAGQVMIVAYMTECAICPAMAVTDLVLWIVISVLLMPVSTCMGIVFAMTTGKDKIEEHMVDHVILFATLHTDVEDRIIATVNTA